MQYCFGLMTKLVGHVMSCHVMSCMAGLSSTALATVNISFGRQVVK
jgi:hypothetical protein